MTSGAGEDSSAWMNEHMDALTSSRKVYCRKLMLSSMAGVVITLLLLGYAFHLAESDSPEVTPGASMTCPAPDCAACLHQVCTCSAHACSFQTFLARTDSASGRNLPWLLSSCSCSSLSTRSSVIWRCWSGFAVCFPLCL